MFMPGQAAFASAADAARALECTALGAAPFAPLEQKAIALGRTDRLRTILPSPGWLRTALGYFAPPVMSLANPRLEALRRLVVGLRLASLDDANAEIRNALGMGFSALQLAALAELVGGQYAIPVAPGDTCTCARIRPDGAARQG